MSYRIRGLWLTSVLAGCCLVGSVSADAGADKVRTAISDANVQGLEQALRGGATLPEDALFAALGNTSLDASVRLAMVQALVAAGADSDGVDRYGEHVLSHALRRSDWPLVQWLLANGADPNRPAVYRVPAEWSPYGTQLIPEFTLLKWCARGCTVAQFRQVLDAGGDPLRRNGRGEDALYYAISGGRADALQLMIEYLRGSMDAEVLAAELDSRHHLLSAVRMGYVTLARILAGAGASPNLIGPGGQTPLTEALTGLQAIARDARQDQRTLVRALLDAGADPNLANGALEAPLYLAVGAADVPMVQLLLERGADVRPVATPDPLLYAVSLVKAPEADLQRTVRLLIDAGARLNSLGWNGSNLLSVAAYNIPHLVPLLIEAGLDVNHRDNSGHTPLMFAAYMRDGAVSIVPDLLAAGARVDAQTRSGWTALMIAAKHVAYRMVDLLLEAGADPTLVSGEGLTALDYAQTVDANWYHEQQLTIQRLQRALDAHAAGRKYTAPEAGARL